MPYKLPLPFDVKHPAFDSAVVEGDCDGQGGWAEADTNKIIVLRFCLRRLVDAACAT